MALAALVAHLLEQLRNPQHGTVATYTGGFSDQCSRPSACMQCRVHDGWQLLEGTLRRVLTQRMRMRLGVLMCEWRRSQVGTMGGNG